MSLKVMELAAAATVEAGTHMQQIQVGTQIQGHLSGVLLIHENGLVMLGPRTDDIERQLEDLICPFLRPRGRLGQVAHPSPRGGRLLGDDIWETLRLLPAL